MDIKEVKRFMNKMVYNDTVQKNIEWSSTKDVVLAARILRKNKKNQFYYQSELSDEINKNSVIIVPLEDVLTEEDL